MTWRAPSALLRQLRGRNTVACLQKLPSYSSVSISKEETIASDMIKYAKSLKLDEASYSEAVRVLEQGLTYFSGDGLTSSMSSGRLQLCLATIHAERSHYQDAVDTLQNVVNTRSIPMEIKGTALEALACLCLQQNQDDEALVYANRLLSLFEESGAAEQLEAMKWNSFALKKLTELGRRSSHPDLDEEASMLSDLKDATGNALLAFAEYSHVNGSFNHAKVLYEKTISISKTEMERNDNALSSLSITTEAIQTGALAGLGQLLTDIGEFEAAESFLTEALKLAEKTKGEKHPQVGAILSCVGNLYQRRAVAEGRSELLIIEGMYKSALDLMKAQTMDKEIKRGQQYADVIVLTRARLGVALAPLLYRRTEVEKLKCWVEAACSDSQLLPDLLYLKDLLVGDDNKKQKERSQVHTIVDVRLGRTFFRIC